MSLGYSSTPIPFQNKGIVQRHDPSLLEAGEYYTQENMYSRQEGALVPRTGHKKLSPTALATACVSISKLNLGGADSSNPRYLGSGAAILRTNTTYATSDITPGYVGITSGLRWGAAQYNAGTSGIPALYFATQNGSFRDNGSYAKLQKWGIDAPVIPVTATPNVPNATSLNVSAVASHRFIDSVNSDASGRKTVSFIGTGPGYTKITPTAGGTILGVTGIYVGMLLTITDPTAGNETVIVLAVDSTSCYAITTINHGASVLGTMFLSYTQSTQASVVGTVNFTFLGFAIDASFNGVPENGYSTDDFFHIALRCNDVANVSQIAIQVVPNFTGVPAPYATDYYEYKILPSSVMSSGTATDPNWVELNIPKSSFTNVGNAGSGVWTWKNINEIYISITSTVATATIGMSSIYFVGGGGLDSISPGTTPYDYLCTFRNPTSGAEGNPCVPMIDANIPPPIQKGKMSLSIAGKSTAVADGDSELSGPGSIKIYRRGGTFSDGLYRHIGYATNPGASSSVTFTDNASDESINTADILEFDNNPPVQSSLKTGLTANILFYQPTGGGTDYTNSISALTGGGTTTGNTTNGTVRLVLSNLPTNFTASTIATTITVGTKIQFGFGLTYEEAIISSVGYSTSGHATSAWVEVYVQFNHTLTSNDASETIECGSINRGNCDIVHTDFDCAFLAGDSTNPAVLYQSKVGRPETFPVVNGESGVVHQINVGSPSNPIMGVTSLNAELVSLNLDNIFIVNIWQGQMQSPQKTLSSRGLYAKNAWCIGDNKVWFLAYDGVYMWAGGQSEKVSENIDYIFKNQTVNGILPADMTQASKFSFSYAENQLYFTYINTSNVYHRMRFDTNYNRWTGEYVASGSVSSPTVWQINDTFTEPDTGNLLVSVTDNSSNSYLWRADFYSTSDGWSTDPSDGLAIIYQAWRYWPLGDVGTDYQVGEVVLEMQNPSDALSVNLFYNYSTSSTELITIASGANATRSRYMRQVNNGTPQVAYSIGAQFYGSSATGSVALYTFSIRELKLEELTTGPQTDWDSLGHPYDKLLFDVTIQYDTGGQSIDVNLDTISGLNGNTQALDVATYSLTGAGRSQHTFLVPDRTLAKMIRLRPTFNSDLRKFKFWQYKFRAENYPADNITATPWTNSGYGCDKVFKSLNLVVDTGGVECSVAFQIDGSTVNTFTVTSTFSDRGRIITLPSNLIGKEWRLVPTPGTGGKFQLFSAEPFYVREPCAITHFDSLQQVFGFVGFKFIKQIWLEYQCAVPVILYVYRDDGQLFYQVTLPAHEYRDTERFFLPAVNFLVDGTGTVTTDGTANVLYSGGTSFDQLWDNLAIVIGGTVYQIQSISSDGLSLVTTEVVPAGSDQTYYVSSFNKSKEYQFILDSSDGLTPFKLYQDGSRVETRNLDGDQRAGYNQHILWEKIPLAS